MAPRRPGGTAPFESQKNKVHRVHKKGGKAKRDNEANKVKGNNEKIFRSAVSAAKAIRSSKSDILPFNTDCNKYYAAKVDKSNNKIHELSGAQFCYNLKYRRVCPSKVELSLNDRSQQLSLCPKRTSVIGSGGYCTVRATHGVSRGTWYYEACIVNCSAKSSVRIGWSQLNAPLDCSLGFSKFSYAVRSKKGTKFHDAIGRKYYSPGFEQNKRIGILIHLPQEKHTTLSDHVINSRKQWQYFHVGDEDGYFLERTDGFMISSKILAQDCVIPGSRIEYFVDGVSCGVAFEDIYPGFYFPSISLYGYDHPPPEVAVIFDEVRHLPEGARSLNERADEETIELLLTELLDFIEEAIDSPDCYRIVEIV